MNNENDNGQKVEDTVIDETMENIENTNSNDTQASNSNDEDTNITNEEIDELRELVIAKDKEAKDNLDKYMRTMAEYDNFRKRTIKEKSDMYDKGIIDVTTKFLDVIDNFDRALVQLNSEELNENEKKIYDGLMMVNKQFDQIFSNLGIKAIETKDQEFDPNFHNAVMHIDDESFGENMICEEYQKGYTYNDKVIRYSQVKVAN